MMNDDDRDVSNNNTLLLFQIIIYDDDMWDARAWSRTLRSATALSGLFPQTN